MFDHDGRDIAWFKFLVLVLRLFNDLSGLVWSDGNDRVSLVLPELTQRFSELL